MSVASQAAETDMDQFRNLVGLIHTLQGFDQSLTAFFARATGFRWIDAEFGVQASSTATRQVSSRAAFSHFCQAGSAFITAM